MGNSSSSSTSANVKTAAAGEKFINEVSKKAGVRTLPSGMRFRILSRVADTNGTLSPNATDSCSVHYHGTLISGKVFDSSMESDTPATFAPSQVIAGWTEALQYMVEGEEWEVYLPPNLAYGSRGAGGVIPPHAALTFKIHLLSVKSGGKSGSEGHKKLEDALSMKYSSM